ncbi:molybdenum cofactor biosynthesis protein [Vararia minispora EC-137]|uniref:Molybdenum cofactor biosynthesis protein n=1 Tax=Vararia minispora EC-137 TaxID=1314806 RepID=A0ACB8QZF7_9AGAM|nr:molybdenum cofactor biosynthesis protein [Vararia minispora EC-137]
MSKFRVSVLTVSDTAAQDASKDQSGPAISSLLTASGRFDVEDAQIISDDEIAIQSVVRRWSSPEARIDWIITTGGTGFGVRDKTPEAVSNLIERHASGLVHMLLSASLQKTPFAGLGRPVAGTIKDTLIVTLPGSVKAVKESLEALLGEKVIDHALELIRGGSGATLHQELVSFSTDHQHAYQHAHGHHRGNHSHDHHVPRLPTTLSHNPSLAPTARHRISPYKLTPFDDAMQMIFSILKPLPLEKKLVGPSLKGYVLAEDVYAPNNVPVTKTTSVDGYALRSTDRSGIYKVVTSATHDAAGSLPEGVIYRINTGGPLPRGADTVIMVEDTKLVQTVKGTNGMDEEELEVETLVELPLGENVRDPGSDVKAGDLVLKRGEILHSTGGEIGTLTFVGRAEVQTVRKPTVAILSTGNELVDLQKPVYIEKDGWGGIFDTNRPSLQAALEGLGYDVYDIGIVGDDIQSHVKAIKLGLERADVLLTTGGTSMGASDLLKPVIERHFNGTIHFGRVKAKPGKPTTFATIPANGGGDIKTLFALPGNPASAIVTFHVFVVPALRWLGGWPLGSCQFPRVRVTLEDAMRLDHRVEFHRVVIKVTPNGLRAYSTGGQRSSRVASLSGANGLVVLPEMTDGKPDVLERGSSVQAMIIGELQML